MSKSKDEILERIKRLEREKETIELERKIAELLNELYAMDVEAAEYDVRKGYKTKEEAESYLEHRRWLYWGE